MSHPAWRAWALVLAYAAMVFVLSAQSRPLPFLPATLFRLDWLLHLAEYAVLGALLARALRAAGRPAAGAFAWALLLASLYGVSDEIHQAFVPNRSADPRDWAADTAGAAIGAAAVAFLRRRGAAD